MPPRAREIEARRKAFIRKWRLKHRAVAHSLQDAGDRLFTFVRLPPTQWRSARTTNAIERLHEEFKRRTKTQTVLPSADPRPCNFGRCLPRARSTCAKLMVGRPSPQRPLLSQLTSQPDQILSTCRRSRRANSNHISDATSGLACGSTLTAAAALPYAR
jgi:Transposase, Mutator family